MSNVIFFPTSPLVEVATLTDVTGTSSTKTNALNNRPSSKLEVDTVAGTGSDEYKVRIDVGSGNTLNPTFIAFVNHNLYQETCILQLYNDTADNASLTSPWPLFGGGDPSPRSAISTDEPIWLERQFSSPSAKRYHWILFDSIAATAYLGCLLFGIEVEPSVDPNLPITEEHDRMGAIVNRSSGGVKWVTRNHKDIRVWDFLYELIDDTNQAKLVGLWRESDGDAIDRPLIFTLDGGTTFYYGLIVGNPVVEMTEAGLWNVNFQIEEVIA